MTGMKPMKRFYYRAYQTVFDLGSRVLPWRKPEIVSGAGSTARIPELLRSCGVKKVMIVSGKHTGAALVPPIRAQIEAAGISAVHFDAVRANPTISIIEQVRERYLAEGCDGFLAVGGGSPMDTAKAAAARIVRPNRTVEQMTGQRKNAPQARHHGSLPRAALRRARRRAHRGPSSGDNGADRHGRAYARGGGIRQRPQHNEGDRPLRGRGDSGDLPVSGTGICERTRS